MARARKVEPEAWTADEVLGWLAEQGAPIARRTWHAYVAREQAPEPDPALQVGRTPRWRAEQIREWHAARLGRGGPGRPRQSRARWEGVRGMGWIDSVQQRRDHEGRRCHCSACGHAGTPADPLGLDNEGYRVHRSHTTDPASGMYGTAQPDGPAGRR